MVDTLWKYFRLVASNDCYNFFDTPLVGARSDGKDYVPFLPSLSTKPLCKKYYTGICEKFKPNWLDLKGEIPLGRRAPKSTKVMDVCVNEEAILGLHFPALVAWSDATWIRDKLSWPGVPRFLTHEITWVILSHYIFW